MMLRLMAIDRYFDVSLMAVVMIAMMVVVVNAGMVMTMIAYVAGKSVVMVMTLSFLW